MALDVFSSVRHLLKPEDIATDNWIFKLHYKVSVMLFLASSAVGVSKQYFGDPINCQTASGVSSKVMDDYCWIHSTFHVRSEFQGNVGCILDTVLAGKNSIALAAAETPDTAFYQWVPFALVFQALLFYAPRKCWKSFEGGLMESFGHDAKKAIMLADDCQFDCEHEVSHRDTVARKYAKFFVSTLHRNNGYFLQFFLCEVLNFIVDVSNIYITDVFLGGRFLQYGTRVLAYYSHSHSVRRDLPNPMCTVFPTVTSCTFHSVGTAAGEQKFNSLCVLSLNIINEKIYILLWFWLFFLASLTAVHLLYRLATMVLPYSRSILIMFRARMFGSADLRTVRRILSRCYLGDWWVLYQIGRNSNTHFYRYLLRHIELTVCGPDEDPGGDRKWRRGKKPQQQPPRRGPPAAAAGVQSSSATPPSASSGTPSGQPAHLRDRRKHPDNQHHHHRHHHQHHHNGGSRANNVVGPNHSSDDEVADPQQEQHKISLPYTV